MVKTKRNLLLIILSVVFALTLISFVAAKPVNAEASVITLKETASVRIDPDGKNGIRFTGYVSRDVELDDNTFAGIIVGKGEYAVEDLTVEDDVINVKAERFDSANSTEDAIAFNAVIWDIPQVAYAQELTARAYLCDNGEYTYSDAVLTRSLAEVASKSIIEDNPVGEDLNVLKGYVAGANPVVKVGENVVTPGTNNITIVAGEKYNVTVEPANLSFTSYEVNGGFIVLANNVLTANYAVQPAQSIAIELGGEEYLVNVKVSQWYDEDLDEYVLADFDTEKAVYSLQNGRYVNGGFPGTYAYDNGALKVTGNANHESSFILKETINMGDLYGFYFNIKVDDSITDFRIGVNGTSKPTTSTGWFKNTLKFDGAYHTFIMVKEDMTKYASADAVIDRITFSIVGGSGSFCLDEIGIIPATGWEDTNISDDMLVDFNEPQVLSALKTSGGANITYLNPADATAELGEQSDGALKITGGGYHIVDIPFNKSIKKNDVAGFYMKLRHNISAQGQLMFIIRKPDGTSYIQSAVQNWANMQYVHTMNQVTTINFSHDDMYSTWQYGPWISVTGEDIDNIAIYILEGATVYIEEIGLATEKEEGLFIDFNETYDIQHANGRFSTVKQLMPGDEGYPADKGATTGVLMATADSSNQTMIYPGVTVDGSKVSKIIARVYVPTENTETYNAVRLSINATRGSYDSRNHNNFDYKCIEVKANGSLGNENHFFDKGAFVDVTFDVAGKLAAGPIHTLMFHRPWQSATSGSWYIDSIRYVMA